ncbi:glycosyltransferase family 2 protein [Roseofilum casamattae]|uniref:Glycosyltransferase family 2 protein n=1 Tax=Roseofilum casamattae BLCC-M143 TaxID=3022442 RepID=A0ABT7C3W4_9CYAN|nr:glycosyltransferase family 2 protein [Roseofilum casamattae]MDJ1185318.1 glycosyltransferase family 2 protein [Roseofilum casamattae BLCC-M143]
MNPTYSIIIPIYNEEQTIPELYRRTSQVMDRLLAAVELILVNDGSSDGSLELIRDLQEQDSRVCYLSFARNFGHQIAVTAGLNYARGRVVAILDGDLQDPPELILDMQKLWEQGYHVVYAQRTRRHQESLGKQWLAYLFYRILQNLADVEIPADTGDFCLLDRRVVDLLNQMPERDRYIRGLRAWVGFEQTAILYERSPRFSGDVKYTFAQSLALGINGIVSFSKVPLRVSTYLGLVAAAIALLMAALVFYWRLVEPTAPINGFATILIALFFLGAVQLVCIGILGEYIGRIYEEVKGRPLYILAEVRGWENS